MLRNFSWVIDGLVAGMALPSSASHQAYAPFVEEDRQADLEQDLLALKHEHIAGIVSLTRQPIDPILAQRLGLTVLHLPVDDMEAPSLDQIKQFVAYVDRVKTDGGVVVHCGAGVGRTGTMLACYLVWSGQTADEAIQEVRRRRPGSIETFDQEQAVRDYADSLAAGPSSAAPLLSARSPEPRIPNPESRFEIRSARPDDLGRVVDLCAAAFSARDGRDRRADFERRIASDPEGRFVDTHVLLVNGQIVAALRVYDRPVRIGRCILRCAGVGDVATDPAWQGRGYASHLLSETVKTLRARDFDLAWLTGRSAFYRRFGWTDCPGDVLDVTRVVPSRTASTPYHIAPLDVARDRERVFDIYDRFNQERTYTVVRSRAYWEWLARYRPLWDPASFVLGAYQDGDLVGYLCAERRDEELRLVEAGCLPPDTGGIAALITAASAIAVDEGRARVWGTVPLSPDAITRLRNSGVESRVLVGSPAFGNVMIQVLHLGRFLQRLIPELAARLAKTRRHDWRGRVAISNDGRNRAVLEIDGQTVRVAEEGKADIDIPLTPSLLVPVLFGHRSFAEVGRDRAVPLPKAISRLLAVLFPRLYPVYWGTDYV
ncbi:MAG: GNAT family N-acetyltransferase [Candidatus Latescibacteria bacterium]|nr:GNAT family N-acetyltransferase [Candidatus Latescibacterota bacterium]